MAEGVARIASYNAQPHLDVTAAVAARHPVLSALESVFSPVPSPVPLTLLLPGFLPPSAIAGELARHLASEPLPAPTLLRWLRSASAHVAPTPALADTGATTLESWWLSRAGFVATPPAPLGAGLASLLVPDAEPQAQVWVADLVHIQVGRDGLVLTDPATLGVTNEEDAALLASARALMEEAGVTATPISAGRWHVQLPAGVRPYTATTGAAIGKPLESWWPKGDEARTWRRLANEIQMDWHNHPVNQARAMRGETPVNGLWLHGGAPAWQPSWPSGAPRHIIGDAPWLQTLAERSRIAWSGASTPPSQLREGALISLDDLDGPAQAQAWGDWLQALRALDARWFAPLDAAISRRAISAIELVMPGADRVVTLTLRRRAAWLRWLPAPRHDWKTWWHPAS